LPPAQHLVTNHVTEVASLATTSDGSPYVNDDDAPAVRDASERFPSISEGK
jgi:hypothetical protein